MVGEIHDTTVLRPINFLGCHGGSTCIRAYLFGNSRSTCIRLQINISIYIYIYIYLYIYLYIYICWGGGVTPPPPPGGNCSNSLGLKKWLNTLTRNARNPISKNLLGGYLQNPLKDRAFDRVWEKMGNYVTFSVQINT